MLLGILYTPEDARNVLLRLPPPEPEPDLEPFLPDPTAPSPEGSLPSGPPPLPEHIRRRMGFVAAAMVDDPAAPEAPKPPPPPLAVLRPR